MSICKSLFAAVQIAVALFARESEARLRRHARNPVNQHPALFRERR